METLISQIFQIAKEKQIPDQDILTAISILITSATLEARENTQKTEFPDIELGKLQAIEQQITQVTNQEELEMVISTLDSKISQEGSSFRTEFDRILENLLEKYIEKIS